MTHIKTTVCTFMLVSLFWTGWISVSNDAAAAEINWQKYMQSAANVAAIAAAGAFVDNCSKKFNIEESSSDGKVKLTFTCSGKDDEEGTAVIEFESFSDGVLVPIKFYYAG